MLMKTAKDPAFWQKVRSDSAYQEIRSQIEKNYRDSRWEEIPVLKYRPRMRFYGDGDRHEFEKPYFRRRSYLASAALLALIYPEEETYLEDLQECIWAVCCEYSWCLPAHCDGTLEDDLHRIDLFSAETGFTLAEICYVLEDRLDPLVLQRARTEVRSRVIDNFVERRFSWEDNKANWAAVCAGNVGGAMMYLTPEEFDRQLPRLINIMRTFMSGFPADGTCMEGFGYWHYGFGNFLWFADLLYQYTDGRQDLLAWDKVEAVGGYAQRSFLKGGAIITNADSSAYAVADLGMVSYLHRRFPSVSMLPKTRTNYNQGNLLWMMLLRNLLYADHGADHQAYCLQDTFLPEAGQAVLHRRGYSFFMKAGHNREPHNHNDVGAFILATDKGQVFCDLGAGLYTRQYFDKRVCYDIFCKSSRSHSVPIVNGQYQRYGDEYKGTIRLEGSTITAELAESYGQPDFSKLTRTVICKDGKVTLTDAFAPDYDSLCERFVTTFLPEIFETYVLVNGVRLYFDPQKVVPAVSQEMHDLHDATKPPIPVFCIDFELKHGLTDVTFSIEVEA